MPLDKRDIETEMTDPQLLKLLELRLLVGYLGERANHGWWATSFFEPSSRVFLAPVFAKTAELAQYHGVVEAARQVHDEHLSVGSYHLFRCPEEIEEDLHALMGLPAGAQIVAEVGQGQEAAADRLEQLAVRTAEAQGPILLGSIGEIRSDEQLKAAAGHYASAFDRGVRTYPYWLRPS